MAGITFSFASNFTFQTAHSKTFQYRIRILSVYFKIYTTFVSRSDCWELFLLDQSYVAMYVIYIGVFIVAETNSNLNLLFKLGSHAIKQLNQNLELS